jgi:DNA polymerase elongation subunit (family B)
MAVKWKEHKSEVIALDKEGMSSKEIARVLSQTIPEIKPSHDRSIRNALQRWRERGEYKVEKQPAKVLLFDIETSPILAWMWSLRQKYISPENIKQDWFVICWSAKWLFEDEIINASVSPQEARNQNDKRIVEELWNLLDEADIIISHNGDKFDIKKMNGRFIKYNLNLPSPYKSIDTYKAARRRLSLSSLKLDFIADYLDIAGKQDTDFQLWLDCVQGNPDQLDKMQRYCDQDVKVLEDVYLELRPFITSHPNLGLSIKTEAKACPACGSEDLTKTGTYDTNVNSYDAFRCGDCGSLTRSRHSNVSKEDKETLTRSIAR